MFLQAPPLLQHARKLLCYLSLVTLLLSLSVFQAPIANAAMNGLATVTLADSDNAGHGIDGRDFSISWDVATLADATQFIQYAIYIIPGAEADIAIEDIADYTPVFGQINQIAATEVQLPQFVESDSSTGLGQNPAALAGGNYKACVVAQGDDASKITCSASTAITSDVVADQNPPFIMHVPVHTAFSGGDATFTALIFDDQTTAAQFDDDVDGENENFILHYGVDVSDSETTVNADIDEGALFTFTMDNADLQQNDDAYEYYLSARDRAGNTRYVCENPDAAVQADCNGANGEPFTLEVDDAGAISVSGTIRSGGNGLADAKIMAGGFAKGVISADGAGGTAGEYTIAGLPSDSAIDVIALKTGYCDNGRFEPIGAGNLTDIDLNLNEGECDFDDGGGDGGGKPHVVFNSPPQNLALDESLRVGFNSELNAQTVNDIDPTDGGSNVFLTPDDGSTKVAGNVLYCEDDGAPGCEALFQQDENVILFDPTNALTANTRYTLVMTEAVTSQSGQSIEGNRPGGGHRIDFNTGGGDVAFNAGNFGLGGDFMPPFVEAMVPAPGITASPNTKILLRFNEAMDSTTITDSNIILAQTGVGDVDTTVSLDNNERQNVTITPDANLTAGDYELRVLGAVAKIDGLTMRLPGQEDQIAFSAPFEVLGNADATPPTIYPEYSDGATGVDVNSGFFEFGFNEQLDPSLITTSNITLKRGANSVASDVEYDPGENIVSLVASDVLAPNTTYTITFTSNVTDLAGVALAAAQSYSFTTGGGDAVDPNLREVRCDDSSCQVFFTEPMNSATEADGADEFADSVLNVANITLAKGDSVVAAGGGTDLVRDGVDDLNLFYDPVDFALVIEGHGLGEDPAASEFALRIEAASKDISGNGIDVAGNANIFIGQVEDSSETFGDFGGGGMFGPPMDLFGGAEGGGGQGGQFEPKGFGDFTPEQFFNGQAVMAFPFNPMAGQDSNVFQACFAPGLALADNDQVVLTFPNGTDLTNAIPDTYSPFYEDMNEHNTGTVSFDAALDADGVEVNAAARTVTAQLTVANNPPTDEPICIDLRGIINPSIPKGPETGGHKLGIKINRAGETLDNKESMPYFVSEGGSNSITVRVFAGTAEAPIAGADGGVFLFGGGPSGPMDRDLTLTDGAISAVDGAAGTTVVYSNLIDGCYFVGTDPFMSLGGVDYFGQHMPEPVCVNGGETPTKDILLSSAEAGGASVAVTVKLAGIADFGGADIDLFAGGPGNFVVKTLSDVGVPNAGGYTLRLPQDGSWFVGLGPSISKSSGERGAELPGMPPPPIDIIADVDGDTIAAGFHTSPGVTLDAGNKTITFTFAAADKAITGTVTDGAEGLGEVEVFVHGPFGGTQTTTLTDGTFDLNISDYGSYEIGAMKDGLNPMVRHIEVQPDGDDAGADPDIYFKGKQITDANELELKLNKPDYYISGKVLDDDSNGVGNAPVFGQDANGEFIGSMTDSSGNYTLFVGPGTWTLKSEMPPDKTDSCSTYSKTVQITDESKSNQNIAPLSEATCYSIAGTVTADGAGMANVPLVVEAWDTINDRPAGGFFKPSSTSSTGTFEVNVADGSTYRACIFDPDSGEHCVEREVDGGNEVGVDISLGVRANVTFEFTGGVAGMETFIELETADGDARLSKREQDLSENKELSVPAGDYEYIVDVEGFGTYTGTVTAGNTATVDLSGSNFVTVSGNINDDGDTDISGALVTFEDTTTKRIVTTVTDENGDYSASLKEGTYEVDASIAGYVGGAAPETVVLTDADVEDYNFGGGGDEEDQLGLEKAGSVITGTLLESDGVTAMEDGFVTAVKSDGLVATAPIDPDGTFSIPVTDGDWTIKGIGALHAKTILNETITVAGGDVADKDITLTADATKTTKSVSKSVGASTGGTINDIGNTGMKLSAGPGVLGSTSQTINVDFEKKFTAPDTANFRPLCGSSFGISATGDGAVTDLTGNAELQIDYTDSVECILSGVEESDLKLAYFSPEVGEYITVEGGFVVDTASNTITGQVDHFTDFAIVSDEGDGGGGDDDDDDDDDDDVVVVVNNSGGGGGGGGGGSSGNTGLVRSVVLTIGSVIETDSLSENVVAETEYAVTADFAGDVSLQDVESGSFFTIPTGVIVYLAPAEGEEAEAVERELFIGSLLSPRSVDVDLAPPADRQAVSEVFEMGADGVDLEFSAPVDIVIPLNQSTLRTAGEYNVYYYDEETEAWVYVEDCLIRSLDGGFVCEFDIDHMTKYAVFEDIVEEEEEVKTVKLPQYAFFDTRNHWAKDYVADLYAKKIVKGVNTLKYAPDQQVTRAEFLKIALKAFDVEVPDEVNLKPFRDVKLDAWYVTYVQAAKDGEIVGGYADRTFRPDDPITRAEAVKVLLETVGVVPEKVFKTDFSDVKPFAWYGPYVQFAASGDIVGGYENGGFGPDNNLTRGEVAKIVSLMMKMDFEEEEVVEEVVEEAVEEEPAEEDDAVEGDGADGEALQEEDEEVES
jgi:hypothetical protein